MKTSNTQRFEELMRFKNEFNAKLKESFEKYESRIKNYHSQKKNDKNKTMNKYPTTIELAKENIPIISTTKKTKKLPPLIPKYIEEKDIIYKLPRRSRSDVKGDITSTTWKPQYMINDYFDLFRRLQDKHEIDDWEKVINYNFIYFFYYLAKS